MKKSMILASLLASSTLLSTSSFAYYPYGGPMGYGPQGYPQQGYGYGYQQMPQQMPQQRPPQAAAPAATPQARSGPAAVLEAGLQKLVDQLSSDNRDPAQLQAFIQQEIAPYFDFAYMAKWAAGPLYRNMSDEQKRAMEAQIQKMFFTAMGKTLSSSRFGKPHVAVGNPYPGTSSNEMVVPARISSAPQAPATAVKFRFYKSDAGWKIFDVSANGVSAVIYFRNHFQQQLRQGMGGGY